MKKLTLQLDDLRIHSFQMSPSDRSGGTVIGESCPGEGRTCDMEPYWSGRQWVYC